MAALVWKEILDWYMLASQSSTGNFTDSVPEDGIGDTDIVYPWLYILS